MALSTLRTPPCVPLSSEWYSDAIGRFVEAAVPYSVAVLALGIVPAASGVGAFDCVGGSFLVVHRIPDASVPRSSL